MKMLIVAVTIGLVGTILYTKRTQIVGYIVKLFGRAISLYVFNRCDEDEIFLILDFTFKKCGYNYDTYSTEQELFNYWCNKRNKHYSDVKAEHIRRWLSDRKKLIDYKFLTMLKELNELNELNETLNEIKQKEEGS